MSVAALPAMIRVLENPGARYERNEVVHQLWIDSHEVTVAGAYGEATTWQVTEGGYAKQWVLDSLQHPAIAARVADSSIAPLSHSKGPDSN